MTFENYFPVWNQLTADQKSRIQKSLITRHVKKGTMIHNGNTDCLFPPGRIFHRGK